MATIIEAKGRLAIIGSGIASISDLTLGAVSQIQQADRVFYCIADPATAAFIRSKNNRAEDLYIFYDNHKNRADTYCQMAECRGRFLRPSGLFVAPSHRAVAIARLEGFPATIYAGISAEDCMWADLGIDPCKQGCLTYEASDMLLRDRPVLPSSHLVLFQVGLVGVPDYNFKGFENRNLDLLLDKLEDVYGPSHLLIHYIAAVMPGAEPVIEQLTIARLRSHEIQTHISGISTFYIPPMVVKPTNISVLHQMGLISSKARPITSSNAPFPLSPYMAHLWSGSAIIYSASNRRAIANLDTHSPPSGYQPLVASSAMQAFTAALALSPSQLRAYLYDRRCTVQAIGGLSERERDALISGDPARIRAAMTQARPEGEPDSSPPETENSVEVVVTVLGEEGESWAFGS